MTTAFPLDIADINVGKFASKMTIGNKGDCWPWLGAKYPSGYGVFSVKRRARRAHRIAYIISRGPLPEGVLVLHKCDNPICCNPNHLFLGTSLDNVEDRNAKGRQAQGARSSKAKLTAEQVCDIRADQRSQREIAKSYNLCKSTIGYIKRGEAWKGLP